MWGTVADIAGKGAGFAGQGISRAVNAASYVGEVRKHTISRQDSTSLNTKNCTRIAVSVCAQDEFPRVVFLYQAGEREARGCSPSFCRRISIEGNLVWVHPAFPSFRAREWHLIGKQYLRICGEIPYFVPGGGVSPRRRKGLTLGYCNSV